MVDESQPSGESRSQPCFPSNESQPFLVSWQIFLHSVFTSHIRCTGPPHLPSRPINPSTRTSFQGKKAVRIRGIRAPKKLLGLGGLGIRRIRVWGIRAPKKLLGLGGLGSGGLGFS